MRSAIEHKKEIERILKYLCIKDQHIESFKIANNVKIFDKFLEVNVCDMSEVLEQKIKLEINGNIVYAVTHEITEQGETYAFLLLPKNKKQWTTIVKKYRYFFIAYAYVWNVSKNEKSYYGEVAIKNFNGGIVRVA